jgi:hypothetical protein
MGRHQTFSQKFWDDKHGHFVVWQKPNTVLIIWFVTVVLTIILPDGFLERDLSFIGELAIIAWGIMELGWGVNYFRRLLGFCVLLLIVTARFL